MDYRAFLESKSQLGGNAGFEPVWMPEFLFDFQAHLTAWAIRKGRAALYEDCGLGKTPQQLVWAENVFRKTGKPVLILTPLAVAGQTAREADKFGIEAAVSRDGKITAPIVITNYERLHYFDATAFAGAVCDESSAIKSFDAQRTSAITEFMRRMSYRLLCTATAAPNDYFELGTSSEALGYMGFRDMITTFFKQEVKKDYLGWGRTKYRFRGHAERPFWRWVCSWARAIRKPSDYGFDDRRFVLPPLHEHETVIKVSTARDGMLFALPAQDMQEEREERRLTLKERCERVAAMVNGHQRPAIIWCHLNPEGDLLERLIPDAKQVSGSTSDDDKERLLEDFTMGRLRCLVTKPKIGCWGLNWQHCSDVYTFPSHSFEQYYQAVRRCWRFGQEKPVTVNIVTSEGEVGVMKNLQRKSEQASNLFSYIVECMGNELHLQTVESFPATEELPAWLSSPKKSRKRMPCTTATAAK